MKSIKYIICLVSIISILGCSATKISALENTYELTESDIELYQEILDRIDAMPVEAEDVLLKSTTGTYPTRKGVVLVTADEYKGIIPLGHAAIVYSATVVVEALAEGVVTGNNNWNTTKDTAYGLDVTGTSNTQDEAAANYCYSMRGYPYNYTYLNTETRTSFYCSQLVWAAFKDLYGIDLNTSYLGEAIYPMELCDSPYVSLIYRKS